MESSESPEEPTAERNSNRQRKGLAVSTSRNYYLMDMFSVVSSPLALSSSSPQNPSLVTLELPAPVFGPHQQTTVMVDPFNRLLRSNGGIFANSPLVRPMASSRNPCNSANNEFSSHQGNLTAMNTSTGSIESLSLTELYNSQLWALRVSDLQGSEQEIRSARAHTAVLLSRYSLYLCLTLSDGQLVRTFDGYGTIYNPSTPLFFWYFRSLFSAKQKLNTPTPGCLLLCASAGGGKSTLSLALASKDYFQFTNVFLNETSKQIIDPSFLEYTRPFSF